MRLRRITPAIGYCAVFLLIILDCKSAIQACADGLVICIKTVIPSLFPFLVICSLLTSRLSGHSIPFGSAFARLCGIPKGSENLFILGLISGYPSGGQIVEQAHYSGILTRNEASRMLAFCNNAGPAFILGMSSSLFQIPYVPILLWVIQILSSAFVAATLHEKSERSCSAKRTLPLPIQDGIRLGMRSTATVCGWVIICRVIISILDRWVLWLFPKTVQIGITGFFELSNGYVLLSQVPDDALRFMLCSAFLSFGGICVWMQTFGVTPHLKYSWFIGGRCLHLYYSLLLSRCVLIFIYPGSESIFSIIIPISMLLLPAILMFVKKSIAIPQIMVYNREKSSY